MITEEQEMNQYDAKCPVCGTVNKDLYLEETEGCMICEHCQAETHFEGFDRPVRIPVYDISKLPATLKKAAV